MKSNSKTENKMKVLKGYIERGEIIRKNKSDELLRIENLIQKFDRSEILTSRLESFRRKHHLDLDNEFFIALAAPSMTGKTQLAFSVESKLPLYFVSDSNQTVYSNFSNLSNDLYYCAVKDSKKCKDELICRGIIPSQTVSLTLLSKISDFKLETLGFIFRLIEEAEAKNSQSKFDLSSWMNYFSNRSVDPQQKIELMSIDEFEMQAKSQDMLSKYYVFIDEFSASPNLIFIRNLCRAIGLTCVLSSTNAKVANLIGSSHETGSGSEFPSVWSVVVPKLPPVPDEIFQHFGLKEMLTKLMSLTCFEDKERMTKLCEYLKDQCKKSRPGVSKFILESIDQVISLNEKSLKVDDFFIAFLHELARRIRFRKSMAFFSIEGSQSNMKLLNGDLFDSKYSQKSVSIEALHMIDNHFYNLKNPYGEDKKPFILFRETVRSKPLVMFDSYGEPFSFQCYFDQSEQLLLLSCLINEMESNVVNVFYPPDRIKDLIERGNDLEVITLCSVIDSSHYTDEEIRGSFKGVPLDNFFRNLINNLNPNCSETRSQRKYDVKFKYGKELENVMKSLKVPFLYPSNNNWPEIYNEMFHPSCSSFRLGTYFRTSNNDQIDAQFDMVGINDENLLAVIKTNENDISIPLYMEIMKKAQAYKDNVFLHVTICRSCCKFHNSGTLKNFMKSGKINAYRLKVSDSRPEFKEFELVPISKSPLNSNPKLISIILETDIIYGKNE